MSVSGEWEGLTITVQLTDEHKPITGRLVEHNARGVVLTVGMHKTYKQGIFEGITESGECNVFISWYRIKLIVTPAKFDRVA